MYWNGSFIGPDVLGTAPIGNDRYKSRPHISRHYRMVGKQEVGTWTISRHFGQVTLSFQLLLTDRCAHRREREVIRVALRANVQTQTIN